MFGRILDALEGVARCPHCGVANPQLVRMYGSGQRFGRATQGPTSIWALYRCTSCGDGVSAKGDPTEAVANPNVVAIFPDIRSIDDAVPEIPKRFLRQAYETLGSPDAAAVMAGSAVDAMLKELGYTEGSVYARIDQAVNDNTLTQAMADWAHWVRLGANRPRHADKDAPHISAEEAAQAVEFADALAYFLFALTEKIRRGIEKAAKK